MLTRAISFLYRVNELNLPGLLTLFLPYHTTPHFPSALSLIPVATLAASAFSPLLNIQSSLAPPALPDLISLLPPFSPSPTARPLLDFLLHLPLNYLDNGETPHRALISFWLQLVAAYLERSGATATNKRLPAGEQGAVLSTLLDVVKQARACPDLLIASYILLARYALFYPFEGEVLRVVMKTLVANKAKKYVEDEETDRALVTTLVVVGQLGEGDVDAGLVGEGKKFLGGSGWKALLKTE